MPEWRAGAAEWEITPPLGIAMTGYAGRPGPADHRLDRLFVRALALQPETGDPVVLVGLDLLGIEPDTVAAIRSGLTEWVAPERLVLNCSHTHAGPTTARLRCMGALDPAYQDLVARWTVSVVREALRDLRPAALRFGTSNTGIGQNRRELRDGRIILGSNPHGTYDPTVSVLRVESPDGSPIACWFSHACHPTILGPRNTGLSAEWPGVAAGVLKQVLGCPAIFAQGCCGDINPIYKTDYAAVRTLGRQLAGAALVAWERAEPLTGSGTDATLETAQLPLQVPSAAEAHEALTGMEERRIQVDRDLAAGMLTADEARVRREIADPLVEWGHDYLHAAESGESRTQPMDVQAVRIGDLGIVATGAETFVEIGLEIQRRSPLIRTVSLGYTNGCYGYLPTEKAFPLGGYEVDAAYRYYGTLMVTPECERLTLEAADRVMGRAFSTRKDTD